MQPSAFSLIRMTETQELIYQSEMSRDRHTGTNGLGFEGY